jgi:hypothetical protein
MSTVNNGPQIVKTSLAFVLDPTVSAGYIKTPKQISNCITWFDASTSNEMVSSSNIVSSWSDKSGNGYVFNSAQLSALPASNFSPLYVSNKINGLGSLYFDGSNDYMFVNSSMGLASATQYTAFVVLSPVYLNASQVAFGMQATPSGGTYEILGYWSALDTFTVGFDGGVVLVNTTSRSDNRSIIHSVVRNGTLANAYLNGFQYATNTTVASTVNSGVARLGIGANTYVNGSAPYKGYICEIIIYNRALSTTERSQVQNYLSNKWRIPLLQPTLTNRDLIFGKLATCQNNNIPIIDKSYRLNPANATGSPLQSNFYFADSVSWMSSVITNTITLEAWVKPNSFTFYGSPGNDLGTIMIANSNFYLSIDSNGKFNIYLVGAITSTVNHLPSTTSVTRHSWNHVVVTFDGAYIRWYLNGVLDKTSSTTYTLGTLLLTNYLGIGAEGAGTFGRNLDGYVAGCKIYGKALTTAEVSQNYESSKTEFSNLPNIVTSGLTIYLDTDVYSSYIGSGTTFNDLTGNGNYFQLTNSPTYVSTEPKNFSLSAASSQYFLYYVSIGNPTGNTGLSLPSANSWTCSFWFRTTTNTTYNPFLSHMGSGPVYCLMGTTGTTLTYYHYNGGWFFKNGTTNILDNVWHQAVFVNAGNTMIIYLDGVVERSSFDSTVSGGNNFVNGFGGSWAGNFTGNLTNFMYYNTNLSATQVLQNYNAQKFRFGK